MKVNMGFLAFQTAKKLQPMKFHFREEEPSATDTSSTAQTLKYSKYFKQNPEMIEFMKVTNKKEEEK